MSNPPPPVFRQTSWPMAAIEALTLTACMFVGWWLTRDAAERLLAETVLSESKFLPDLAGILIGDAVYLMYSFGSRLIVLRPHRRGMRLLAEERPREAVAEFQDSLEFFERHPWFDRFRAVTMMSPSRMSYHEMTLCNIAAAHFHDGDVPQAKQIYKRALKEHPHSRLATWSIKSIETVESSMENKTE